MNDTMIDRLESASYDPEPEPPMTTEEKNAPKIPPARLNWKVGATFSPPETGREWGRDWDKKWREIGLDGFGSITMKEYFLSTLSQAITERDSDLEKIIEEMKIPPRKQPLSQESAGMMWDRGYDQALNDILSHLKETK